MIDPPSYEEYKKWAQKQGIKNQQELSEFDRSKFPPGYPKDPEGFYKRRGTWISQNDLFETELYRRVRDPPSYEEYKKWVQKQGKKTKEEFVKFCKTNKFPLGYTKYPREFYTKKGTWIAWYDLLGTESFFPKDPPSYEEYKKWVQKQGKKNQQEFKDFIKINKLPPGYPKDPEKFYKKTGEWISWGDFLGTGFIASQNREYLSFTDARKEARLLAKKYGIKNRGDWIVAKQQGKIPAYIPGIPWHVYSKERVMKKNDKKI